MSGAHDVQWLIDCREIEALAFLYGRAVDARQVEGYSLFDQCLTPDVEVVYEFGTWRGVEEHKRITAENMLKLFTFTQHVLTNPLITVDGDTARASYRAFGAHGIKTETGQKVVYGGSNYTQDCVRTPQGWRIKRHCCDNSWIDDGGQMMENLTAA